jgi:hypothetical protein
MLDNAAHTHTVQHNKPLFFLFFSLSFRCSVDARRPTVLPSIDTVHVLNVAVEKKERKRGERADEEKED